MLSKKYINVLFVIFVFLISCSKDSNPVTPVSVLPDSQINGPNEDDYDYYVGISYSDPQPASSAMKRFYVIISCEDSSLAFENVSLKVQSQNILLEYANYFGQSFYISYFNLAYADNYDIELSVNGTTFNSRLETLKEIDITLPETLTPQEDLKLNWETEKNPQVHYIETFQLDSNNEFKERFIKNLSPETREFDIPADWLWGNSEATSRAIQLGITNYVINSRICFTISDEVFKIY